MKAFRRRRQQEATQAAEEVVEEMGDDEPAQSAEDDSAADPTAELTALDELDWRSEGPWDITEVDLEEPAAPDEPRIDLGSMIITGFPGAELRLSVAEETQQIVSAMLIGEDSAIELGAFAGPRSGGYWRELREELAEAATEAGGQVALRPGPFGVELTRLLPVTTPDGQEGYQPSRMWVVEGPRWLLRGIVYGQAALEEGEAGSVAALATAFRNVIVRRDEQAMAPGDLLPLRLPEDVSPQE